MFWIPMALAAPDAPATEADVDRLLTQLVAPESDARIAAANALAKTPPALFRHLDDIETIAPECYAKVSTADVAALTETCERWNHAMYHYIRVVSSLAKKSTDARDPVGRACLAKTQPHPDDRVTDAPLCPLPSRLRWMVEDRFAEYEILDPADMGDAPVFAELPEAVAGQALKKAARTGWLEALTPDIPDEKTLREYRPWTAATRSTAFSVLPICGGRPSFNETCAFHLFATGEGRFDRTSFVFPDPTDGNAPAGMPYVNFRMVGAVHIDITEDGRFGVFATDYGCCGDETRRIDVYDLKASPAHHCHLETALPPPGEKAPFTLPTITPEGCSL
jgi:hypothetical protein